MILARDIIHRHTMVTIAPIRTDPCAIVSLSRTVSFLSSKKKSNKFSIAEEKGHMVTAHAEKKTSYKPYPLKTPFFKKKFSLLANVA
jgi:hypothetical protein